MPTKVPPWMANLLHAAAKNMTFYGKNFFGYRAYGLDDQFWLKVYPIPSEIYGGKDDGKRITYRFRVELLPILREFNGMPQVAWDTDAREVVVHGRVQGNNMVLRIMENPPDDQDADQVINTVNGGTRPKK